MIINMIIKGLISIILLCILFKAFRYLEKSEKEIRETITLKVISAKYDNDYIVVKVMDDKNKYAFIEKYDISKVIFLDGQEEAYVKKHFNRAKELLAVELFYNNEIL